MTSTFSSVYFLTHPSLLYLCVGEQVLFSAPYNRDVPLNGRKRLESWAAGWEEVVEAQVRRRCCSSTRDLLLLCALALQLLLARDSLTHSSTRFRSRFSTGAAGGVFRGQAAGGGEP